MTKIFLKAPAKINLFLDVLSRRDDGYHDISSVMQSVSLFDDIVISKTNSPGVKLITNSDRVPHDEKNLAYRVANDLLNRYKTKTGVVIKIFKRIPVGAGLAGGSTDCAATLKGILKLFKLYIPKDDIYKICERYGADVPFCYEGGTVLATGIGNVLRRITPHPKTIIVLAKPDFSISTKYVYEKIELANKNNKNNYHHVDLNKMIEALKHGDRKSIASKLYNVFEKIVAEQHPVIIDIKNMLLENGALGASMTGTGSAVFGYFDNYSHAKRAYLSLKKNFIRIETYLVKTIDRY